jgi:hypothetical protein
MKRILSTLAITAFTLAGIAVPVTAASAVTGAAHASSCQYGQSGNHWLCITPGARCPIAAHNHYGYSKYNGKKYKCVNKNNWRWIV